MQLYTFYKNTLKKQGKLLLAKKNIKLKMLPKSLNHFTAASTLHGKGLSGKAHWLGHVQGSWKI